MIGQADTETSGGDQVGSLGGVGVDDLVALGVLEALGDEVVVGLVEVTHVHADDRRVPVKLISLGNVDAEVLTVLEVDAGDILAIDVRLGVSTLEAEILEERYELGGMRRGDTRVERGDFHGQSLSVVVMQRPVCIWP